jgi:hypothetical protein
MDIDALQSHASPIRPRAKPSAPVAARDRPRPGQRHQGEPDREGGDVQEQQHQGDIAGTGAVQLEGNPGRRSVVDQALGAEQGGDLPDGGIPHDQTQVRRAGLVLTPAAWRQDQPGEPDGDGRHGPDHECSSPARERKQVDAQTRGGQPAQAQRGRVDGRGALQGGREPGAEEHDDPGLRRRHAERHQRAEGVQRRWQGWSEAEQRGHSQPEGAEADHRTGAVPVDQDGSRHRSRAQAEDGDGGKGAGTGVGEMEVVADRRQDGRDTHDHGAELEADQGHQRQLGDAAAQGLRHNRN